MFLQLLTWKLPIKKLVEFIFVPFFVCKFTVFSPHFDSFCEHTWNCGVTRRLIIASVILMWSANSGQDVIINKSLLWNWWSVCVCVSHFSLCTWSFECCSYLRIFSTDEKFIHASKHSYLQYWATIFQKPLFPYILLVTWNSFSSLLKFA